MSLQLTAINSLQKHTFVVTSTVQVLVAIIYY